MTRHAIAVLILLLLPAVTQAQPQAASPANLMFAGLQTQTDGESVAASWRGAPEADVHASAPAPAELPVFRPADQYPVLSLQGASVIPTASSEHAAALHLFTGVRFRNIVHLKWVTTQSNSSVGFEIERRTQSVPRWETVKYYRKPRYGQNERSYTFTENMTEGGVVYYRLRQIGADGRDLASPIVSVMPDRVPQSFEIWQQSSVLFRNYETVSFGLDCPSSVTLSLLDGLGRTVRTIIDGTPMEAGHHIFPFGTLDLPAGMHYLRITSTHGSETLPLPLS